MSRERLRGGNVTADNAAEITTILHRNAVEIVFPEELPFENQVGLWASDPIVMGFPGSAMHTSVFFSVFFPGRTMLVIAHGRDMWVNQVLIDRANNNRSATCTTMPAASRSAPAAGST